MLIGKVTKESTPYVQHDLEVGKSYEVSRINMGQSHTTIYLVAKRNRVYNSVIFEFYEDNKRIDIYADARFNPYLREEEIDD